MPTCECCHKTVENGKEWIHWICEDCKVDQKADANVQQKDH